MIRFAGIDFGAKMAGTTAITWNTGDQVMTKICPKGTDADKWLEDQMATLEIDSIYIDAPLTLPGAYFGNGTDFSYRKADRQLQAMSPMFLGGLTSRAMKFAANSAARRLTVLEVYPSALVRQLPFLLPHYDKKSRESIHQFLSVLQPALPCQISSIPSTYHEVDSILCWLSGYRHQHGLAIAFGDPGEGIIWV